jgi:hypothetical protein
MAADLTPPEAFRMKFRALVPSYSKRHQVECHRRERARRVAEIG